MSKKKAAFTNHTKKKCKPLKVFVSYSHHNPRMKDELIQHLRLPVRQGLIEIWHDRGIVPDEEWERQLLPKLKQADIIIMLVSGAFLASDYCFEKELTIALRRFRAKECISPWILLYQCQWRRTKLSRLQSWPEHGKVMPTSKAKREEAWSRVADMIVEYVERVT